MNDLRLAGDVVDAAQYISTHGETDIEVLFADGSRVLYIKGEDVTPVWLSSPMPEMQPSRPASHLDMTPTQIRCWSAWLHFRHGRRQPNRSEEHTSELQSPMY